MKSLLPLIAFSLLLSACGGSEEKKVAVKETRHFSIGNPMEIVSGTQLNRNIPTIRTLEKHMSDAKGVSITSFYEIESHDYVNGKRVIPKGYEPSLRNADDLPEETVETTISHNKYVISINTQYGHDYLSLIHI